MVIMMIMTIMIGSSDNHRIRTAEGEKKKLFMIFSDKRTIKHRKDCETALWAKKGFIESEPFIEGKALLKEKTFL